VTAAVCGAQVQLLDVPYLPQSESLCGGAAAAMVMRYWGATDVYAETFAGLVDPSAGGIRAADLLGALRARGWTAESFTGSPELVRRALDARRPPIVLIEDRPGRFHYVVIVGWAGGRVIAHDPARAPFRTMDERAFTDAWKKSEYWTVVPDPPELATLASSVARDPIPVIEKVAPDAAPCARMVDEGVRLASGGDVKGARATLLGAAAACPSSAAPWRELAGIHALASEWGDAAADARRALARDSRDEHAARILATALYLQDDVEGALDAWNRVGEPLVDLVTINGLERTRYEVAAGMTGLAPRQLLTRATLQRARRNLADLPSAQTTRVFYTPAENGRARVEAVVVERPLVPTSPIAAAAIGLRALSDREIAGRVSSPSGGGEAWTASWRWWEHRPRVAGSFDAPAPFGGTWGVAAFHETQSYASSTDTIEETHRRVEFHASEWMRPGFQWSAGAAFDTWRGRTERALSLRIGAEQRLARDRLSVSAAGEFWVAGLRTSTLALRAEWRSRLRNEGHVWVVRAGETITRRSSPLALWPGAGTGQGRGALLRAHPLLHDGKIRGVFGPRLTDGGVEWRRWVQPTKKPLRIAPAAFVDVARAPRNEFNADGRWEADAGAGIRIGIPGAGVLRIDAARGLADGRSALSIGWVR
jgi:hypothetical protein